MGQVCSRYSRITAAILLILLASGVTAVFASQALVQEKEDNDTVAQATPLGGTNVVGIGSIYPQSDIDYWSFQATAGDRIYAATMTAESSSATFDTVLDLLSTNGTTILETDDNDGSLAASSSSIAGRLLPATGTYYLKVTAIGFTPVVRPYYLHVRVQQTAAVPETEPNNGPGTANPVPASGHVSGMHLAGDSDWYSIALGAGDSVYLGLDADPERNGITWNPRLSFGFFGDAGDQLLSVDDPNTVSPNSEALFATVKTAGFYYIKVDSAASPGGSGETYALSVSVHPNTPASAACTTYTSADTPVDVVDGSGPVSSTIVVPGHPRIADVDVSIQLNETVMSDLDVHLLGPGGNDVGLFTDVGETTTGGQSQMDLTLDDQAAFPIGSFPAMKRLTVQPESKYRLSWFDGADAGGEWRIQLWDDTANSSVGQLQSWSLTICEPPLPPVCAGTLVTLYSSDFETDDGGFTHSGTLDQWARGLPSGFSDPILSCNSGSNCWKTNLTDVYADGATMILRSPVVSLAGMIPPIRASWAQSYQMENASFDAMEVDVQDLSTANVDNLFVWLDATMDDDVGAGNATYIPMSSGWGVRTANLDAYAGNPIQLVYALQSDNFVGYSGLAVDDVVVTACCTAASCNDGNPCTSDSCDALLGCVHAPVTGPACDDGDPCTTNDACAAGVCAGTIIGTPEVQGLAVAADKATYSWSPVASATQYDVVRGATNALPVGPGGGDETCFYHLAGTTAFDVTVPQAGAGFWYLVRGVGSCGGGNYGTQSDGTPRITATCP
jgi:subtilisin-like proprotein convertase family protein